MSSLVSVGSLDLSCEGGDANVVAPGAIAGGARGAPTADEVATAFQAAVRSLGSPQGYGIPHDLVPEFDRVFAPAKSFTIPLEATTVSETAARYEKTDSSGGLVAMIEVRKVGDSGWFLGSSGYCVSQFAVSDAESEEFWATLDARPAASVAPSKDSP